MEQGSAKATLKKKKPKWNNKKTQQPKKNKYQDR